MFRRQINFKEARLTGVNIIENFVIKSNLLFVK